MINSFFSLILTFFKVKKNSEPFLFSEASEASEAYKKISEGFRKE